jgi:hypothetical protein
MPTEFLPQPPPSVPAPPPGEVALKSRKTMRWIIGAGLASIMLLALYFEPSLQKNLRKGYMITAISNAKQIGLALFEFDSQYGKYPDISTAALVRAKHSTTWCSRRHHIE